MFGVYYFSGAIMAAFAAVIIVLHLVQQAGYLRGSVSVEHYHDLGKFLFGFVFFWGYIAFSQYMLLWYSSIPEEVEWLARRGATTVREDISGWTVVSLAILLGQLLIPFAGLLSRHIKRNVTALVFWAGWVLVFHYIDVYWLIMPEQGAFRPALIDMTCLLAVGGAWTAVLVRLMAGQSLRPLADPRVVESLTFQNV